MVRLIKAVDFGESLDKSYYNPTLPSQNMTLLSKIEIQICSWILKKCQKIDMKILSRKEIWRS